MVKYNAVICLNIFIRLLAVTNCTIIFKGGFVVSVVHFASYLTSLSSMMLIYKQQELDVSEELTSITGCRGRGLNRRLLSL